MKCFYHDDADGICSAFWVASNVIINDKNYYNDEPEFYEINYRKKFPLETIRPKEQVYIIDYSIKPNEMRELIKVTKNITWIDHHKTAIEEYENFEHDIRGIRYSGVEFFESLPQGLYDIFISFAFDGMQYVVSLYSKTVDVSKIAKKYGGGGHKMAAGFQCDKLPFSRADLQ